MAEWLTKSPGAILDAAATRRRPKGEGQDAPSQRARLESECTLIPYRGFDQSAQPIRTHKVRPEGVRSEATNQSRPLIYDLDMERWLSGLRRSLGKRVYAYTVPRVRIPPSPPKSERPLSGPFDFGRVHGIRILFDQLRSNWRGSAAGASQSRPLRQNIQVEQ